MGLTWSLFPLIWAAAINLVLGVDASKPNVLVIMTDDQDMILDSLSVQPNVMKLIAEQGTLYENHYCTVAWCCPSRTNFLTGRAAHNTNVTAIAPPYGGWPKFLSQGLNENYLPVWINESGIATYYVGKFMNAYENDNFDHPHPKGWKHSSFLVDPWTYNYFDSHWTNDYTSTLTQHNGVHTTNVTQTKALDFLDDAAAAGEQFFMMVAPVAPHVQVGSDLAPGPPSPPEFAGAFSDRKVPRTPDFNPDKPSGASWVYNLDQLTDDEVTQGDTQYYHRLENLAGIDAMVAALIDSLESHGLLDNTYVIYTSDNGFHISNHRMVAGKRCGYETDINVPLLIRGPGVPINVNSTTVQSHTDMAPTILGLPGVPLRQDFDGQSIPVKDPDSGKSEYANVEFWDASETPGQSDGDDEKPGTYYNNTYKSIRMKNDKGSFYYSVWCDGSREFYDMNDDYYQMKNLLGPNANIQGITFYGRAAEKLMTRLDALLFVLKGCKQDACRNPYSVLFPQGKVTTLEEAMLADYDDFFANQPKVTFVECVPGNIVELQRPHVANAWSG